MEHNHKLLDVMRLTLGTVKAIVANPLNLKTTDSRVTSYINRAQERLLYMGKWVGTTGRYRVCVNNSCITWPRQIETIEAWALCNNPGSIRNGWYEFLNSGPGIMDVDGCNSTNLIDRGNAVAFDEVTGTNKRLAIYADVTETTTEKVILQYYDSNGNWVRTLSGTSYIDGEELTIPAALNYQAATYDCAPNGLIKVIKPTTNGIIRLYEYDTVALTYKPLGYYAPDETIPVYRRSLIPGLSSAASPAGTYDLLPGLSTTAASTSCSVTDYREVDVMAKLRHVPVVNDNDFLIIEHAEAMRLACQAIRAEEAHEVQLSDAYWTKAVLCLEDQLRHWQGAGTSIPLKFENSLTATAAIPTLM